MTSAPRGSFWTVVGVFILVGAPVGGLAFGVTSIVESPPTVFGLQDLMRFPGFVVMGLVGGFFPAFLTGVLSAAVSSRIGSKALWVLFGTVTGGLVSATVYGMPGAWAYFAPVGGLAAFVSGLAGLSVRPRWAN